VVLGRSAGLDEAKLGHIGDDPLPDDVYDEGERAVVEYARRSSAMAAIDDDLYARLQSHLSTRQILDLCFTVGMSNLVNRFHATFLTEVDPETLEVLAPSCPLPLPEQPGSIRRGRAAAAAAACRGGAAS
jgi:hypothetical protein